MEAILRRPYVTAKACVVIRSLPMLSPGRVVQAETFLEADMGLGPSAEATRTWRTATGAHLPNLFRLSYVCQQPPIHIGPDIIQRPLPPLFCCPVLAGAV